MLKKICVLCCLCLFVQLAYTQSPRTYHAGELQLALKKLNVVGSALYLAAHPDDENTALIAYFANERLLRTGYLSLTRGDGGQNLIGVEQRELMGLIRTQELIQARRTDGGEQFFTRANDFGFSKSAKEAQKIWDKEQVLADMVWVIRNFRPDIIVTRFPPSRDAGHGHHEASAILAEEAFRAAADASRFPEQLAYVQVWQAKRLVWNVFSRRNGQFSSLPNDTTAKIVGVQLGNYNPLLGKTNLTIQAESRSMHKSQGFGTAKNQGLRSDNMQHTLGTPATKDVLDDMTMTWKRFVGTQGFAVLLEEAYKTYLPEQPQLTAPILLEAYQKMIAFQAKTQDQEAKFWVKNKAEETKNLLLACIGFWAEGNATEYSIAVGDTVGLKIEVALRLGNLPITIEKATIQSIAGKVLEIDSLPKTLNAPVLWTKRTKVRIQPEEAITQPYWLTEKPTQGLYNVKDQLLRGKPENEPALKLILQLRFKETLLTIERPITYKWVKPEDTEIYRPLEVTPQVMVNIAQDAYLFAGQQSKNLTFKLFAGAQSRKGVLSIKLPDGWTAEPAQQNFSLKNKEAEQGLTFKITPTANSKAGTAQLFLQLEGETEPKLAVGIQRIDYRHIPMQTVFPTAEVFLDKFDMQMAGKKIGYIEGAGDEIAQCLEQVGYEVTRLKADALTENLTQFDAIVLGVRAYNTQNDLKNGNIHLKKYVEQGGTVIVQYNTNHSLVTKDLGVYPLTLGRERVTVEDAPIKFLLPEHALLNKPNKISQTDFEGWVQERGLYFAQDWDTKYEAILASADPEEPELKGGLLYAKYGKGKFIYTGLAFFRQLPAGVKGAYRLFANLLATEKK